MGPFFDHPCPSRDIFVSQYTGNPGDLRLFRDVYIGYIHKKHRLNHSFKNMFSAFLTEDGRLLHILGPNILKLCSTNFTWLGLTTFKFRFCWLRLGLPEVLNSKIFEIKLGFKWLRVLKSSRHNVLSL